jgi:hypothetical protein
MLTRGIGKQSDESEGFALVRISMLRSRKKPGQRYVRH